MTLEKLEPESLVLVTDKRHRYYNDRVRLHVSASLVQSVKEMGVLNPVEITQERIVIHGIQRVKAAVQVNLERRANGLEPLQIPVIYFD